jgi:hypothetical protein
VRVSRFRALGVDERVAAHLAEPGVERRLAPIGVEALDRLAEGLLHHLAGALLVAAEPRQREAIKPREKAVEQPPKGGFVAAEDPAGQRPIHVDRVTHARIRSVIASLDVRRCQSLRSC